MKHLLNFDKFSLNELKINSMDSSWDGKNFISYRGDVWIFDEDEWEDESVLRKRKIAAGRQL